MRKALSARKVSAFFANDALTTLPHSQNGNALTGLVLLRAAQQQQDEWQTQTALVRPDRMTSKSRRNRTESLTGDCRKGKPDEWLTVKSQQWSSHAQLTPAVSVHLNLPFIVSGKERLGRAL